MYPIKKGRYRLMMLFRKALIKEKSGIISDLYGEYRFALDLSDDDLQSSFYYFMPENYEHETQRYIRNYVKPGMVALDIGAHVGLMSLLLAHKVGKTGKVYSFEPNKENFLQFQRNIDLNSLSQVQASQKALSNKSGEDYLVHAGHSSGYFLSNAKPNTDNRLQLEKISTLTLDEFVDEHNLSKIDLVKLDAEGGEHLVLEGGKKALKRGVVPNIICEVHSSHKQSHVGQDRIRRIFYSYGYKSYILNSKLSRRNYLDELKPNEPVTGLQNLLFTLPNRLF
jgi:FkbM family methyltransferase